MLRLKTRNGDQEMFVAHETIAWWAAAQRCAESRWASVYVYVYDAKTGFPRGQVEVRNLELVCQME